MTSTQPPPGWYPDPYGGPELRWWDGQQWTGYTAPRPSTSNVVTAPAWRQWITTSRTATRISWALAILASVAAAVCTTIIVADLVRQQPIDGVSGLLVIGGPLLVAGQLWMIGLGNARRPPSAGGRSRWHPVWARPSFRTTRALFFGDLDARVAAVVLALAILGWLSAVTAFPFITGGGPADPGGGCLYRLAEHGTYSCVSRTTYEHAGAGVQRFASGILLAFYSVHAGAALGRLSRRRQQSDA